MLVDVVMPKMGESIQEGKILRWMKKPGDKIEKDESILEISTDKVDSEIPSPSAGVLVKIIVPEGETVDVGTVIAMIESDASVAVVEETTPARHRDGDRFYSPLVKTIARKEGVALEELDHMSGTGIGGRLTKSDLLEYLTKRAQRPSAIPQPDAGIRRVDLSELQKKYPAPKYEIRQMDNVQVKMAEHKVASVRTSPH